MNISTTRRLLALAAACAALCVSDDANAVTLNFGYECVEPYGSVCGNGPDLPAACDNTAYMYTELISHGWGDLNSYANGSVWNTDMMDWSRSASPTLGGPNHAGRDYLYTDKPGTKLWYFSGHGAKGLYADSRYPGHTCGDAGPPSQPCSLGGQNGGCCYVDCQSDADCQDYCANGGTVLCNTNGGISQYYTGCDLGSHTCSTIQDPSSSLAYTSDRQLITCGTGDQLIYPTDPHSASITRNMAFGEYPGIQFGNAGTDGGVYWAVFDSSFPFASPFFIELNRQVFTGLHIEMGYSASGGGDNRDAYFHAVDFTTLVVGGDTIAHAWNWMNQATDNQEFGQDLDHPDLCTVAMSCAFTEQIAGNILAYETAYSVYNNSSPNWCHWYTWCAH
jgi:hypothetical protein